MIFKIFVCLVVYFTCLPSTSKCQFQFNLDSVISELNRKGYDSVFVFIPRRWHGYDMNLPVRNNPIAECPPSEFLITSVGDTVHLPPVPDSIEYVETLPGPCNGFALCVFFKNKNRFCALKLDYCNVYDTIEIADKTLSTYVFTFFKTILKEKQRPPQTISSHPPPDYDLYWQMHGKKFTKLIDYGSVYPDSDDLHSNHPDIRYNRNLKSIQLIKRTEKCIEKMQNEEKFKILKVKSIEVKHKIKNPCK